MDNLLDMGNVLTEIWKKKEKKERKKRKEDKKEKEKVCSSTKSQFNKERRDFF